MTYLLIIMLAPTDIWYWDGNNWTGDEKFAKRFDSGSDDEFHRAIKSAAHYSSYTIQVEVVSVSRTRIAAFAA